MTLHLHVNGEARHSAGAPLTRLIDILRDDFFLTGTKLVCGEGFCGACAVLLDGRPVMSCLLPACLAEGRQVRTVEGLATDKLAPLQQAMLDHDVVQCGMCFPGILITLTAFLADNPGPSREDLRKALTGNVCRCTGYERILDAVLAPPRVDPAGRAG